MRLVIIALLGTLVLGGAGFGAMVYFGVGADALAYFGIGGAAHGEPEVDLPKLVVREGADDVAVERGLRSGARPDPRLFSASYVTIADPFTVNMGNTGSYVQVGIALSTFYDERVLAAIETHKLAIRSTVLMTLAELDPITVSSAAGRHDMQIRLKDEINRTLQQREGFGGIDEVHFTSFVTQ